MIKPLPAQYENNSTGYAFTRQAELSPPVIRHQVFSVHGLTRQLLVLENNPSSANVSRGSGIALVELTDGRVFFFRTRLEVLKEGPELVSLLDELRKLPEWISNWKGAAELVGYIVGAPLEFLDKDPAQIHSWNISGWKQQAASWLAVKGTIDSIQQISVITSRMADEASDQLSTCLSEFIGTLDPFTIKLQSSWHCSWQSAYNFFMPCNEQQRLYRRQANQTFPLVVQQIFDTPKEQTTASIIQAIDDGVPLVEFLAKLFDCPQKCIRHLNGFRFEDVGTQWVGRLRELLMILGNLDMNRLPKSSHEWTVFGETINLLSTMTKMPTTALSSRLLLGELSKQKWSRKVDASVSFQERALTIERFAEHIRTAMVATAWVKGKDVHVIAGNAQRIATESACALGLSRLESLARKWRTEEFKLDSVHSPQQGHSYPIVLESPLEVGNYRVVQLTSALQLIKEGESMKNCVAGYCGQCSTGYTYIFSVRNLSDQSFVTVEYSLTRSKDGLPVLSLVQQRGINNSTPDVRYLAALDVLKRYVSSSEVKKKLLSLLNYQKISKAGADMAFKYMRSLEFVEFLNRECAGRFDMEKLVIGSSGDEST